MCGIAGFILAHDDEKNGRYDRKTLLASMMDSIAHRGPDDWGMSLINPASRTRMDSEPRIRYGKSRGASAALGHRRLSIIDLSESGRQPMWSQFGEAAVVFNGEIYNYLELRNELKNAYTFVTSSDTEVLLAAYLEWGEAMLSRLDGMFAFAIWDTRNETLFCARDPLGIKPFYYSKEEGDFFFSSEPRAVLAGLQTRGHLDSASLSEFLLFGLSDHDEGTFFSEVKQLRGGTWANIYGNGSMDGPHSYWAPPVGGDCPPDELAEGLHQALALSVRRQLRSDVPVGSCLSGGLDSGALAVTVGKLLGEKASRYTTLTLHSKQFEGDESVQARNTARAAGMSWQAVEADLSDLVKDVESMSFAMGEPYSSLSMLAQFLIMRRAKELGLKVMLDGQGGDELYAGYPRVAQRVLGDKLRGLKFISFFKELNGLRRNASLPMHRSLASSVFFRSKNIATFRNRRRLKGIVENELLNAARYEVKDALFASSSLSSVQMAELRNFCLPRLLRYEDRNSMAFGVEARVPHLGKPVVDFALRIPSEWRVHNGWTKYTLRRAMEGRLPDSVVWNRFKRGFEVPQEYWVTTLGSRVGEWIEGMPDGTPLKAEGMRSALSDGRSGSLWFWRCLSTALWIGQSGVAV